MIDYIGRTVLVVRDYDEAVRYYREKLGFEVLFDQVIGDGYRSVHIGLPSQPGVGLWLKLADSDATRARLGDQSGDGGPFLVLYTSDCRATCAELERRGVRVLRPPAEEPGSIFAHIADLYGNHIVLVELKGGQDQASEA